MKLRKGLGLILFTFGLQIYSQKIQYSQEIKHLAMELAEKFTHQPLLRSKRDLLANDPSSNIDMYNYPSTYKTTLPEVNDSLDIVSKFANVVYDNIRHTQNNNLNELVIFKNQLNARMNQIEESNRKTNLDTHTLKIEMTNLKSSHIKEINFFRQQMIELKGIGW